MVVPESSFKFVNKLIGYHSKVNSKAWNSVLNSCAHLDWKGQGHSIKDNELCIINPAKFAKLDLSKYMPSEIFVLHLSKV